MIGDTFRKRTRRSIYLLFSVSCLIILLSVIPVSASGSGGSGGSSIVTYSSTNLFTNWALITGDYYGAVIKNPSSSVSRVTVVMRKKPSSVTVDYLSYAIAKYSDRLTTQQRSALIDPMRSTGAADSRVTRTNLLTAKTLPVDSLEDFVELKGAYANNPDVPSSVPLTGWALDEEGAGQS